MVKINGREKHFVQKLEDIRIEQLGWLRKFNAGITTFVIVGQVGYSLSDIIEMLKSFCLGR